MEVLIGVIIFILGFLLGVFERRIDRLRISKSLFTGPESEVLKTPTREEQKLEAFDTQFKI